MSWFDNVNWDSFATAAGELGQQISPEGSIMKPVGALAAGYVRTKRQKALLDRLLQDPDGKSNMTGDILKQGGSITMDGKNTTVKVPTTLMPDRAVELSGQASAQPQITANTPIVEPQSQQSVPAQSGGLGSTVANFTQAPASSPSLLGLSAEDVNKAYQMAAVYKQLGLDERKLDQNAQLSQLEMMQKAGIIDRQAALDILKQEREFGYKKELANLGSSLQRQEMQEKLRLEEAIANRQLVPLDFGNGQVIMVEPGKVASILAEQKPMYQTWLEGRKNGSISKAYETWYREDIMPLKQSQYNAPGAYEERLRAQQQSELAKKYLAPDYFANYELFGDGLGHPENIEKLREEDPNAFHAYILESYMAKLREAGLNPASEVLDDGSIVIVDAKTGEIIKNTGWKRPGASK